MNLTFFQLCCHAGQRKSKQDDEKRKTDQPVRSTRKTKRREEKRKMQQPGSLASVPPRSRRDNRLSATKKKERFYS